MLVSSRLSKRDLELLQAVDEVLHDLWDAIGVSSYPGARNEYQSYAQVVFGKLHHGADAAEISAYLTAVATTQMGFDEDADHALQIAGVLCAWRESINNTPET